MNIIYVSSLQVVTTFFHMVTTFSQCFTDLVRGEHMGVDPWIHNVNAKASDSINRIGLFQCDMWRSVFKHLYQPVIPQNQDIDK